MQPSRVKDENKIDCKKVKTQKNLSGTKRSRLNLKVPQTCEEEKKSKAIVVSKKDKPFQTPMRRSSRRLNSRVTCANTNEIVSKKSEDYDDIDSDGVDEGAINILNPSMVNEDHQGFNMLSKIEEFPKFHIDISPSYSSKSSSLHYYFTIFKKIKNLSSIRKLPYFVHYLTCSKVNI